MGYRYIAETVRENNVVVIIVSKKGNIKKLFIETGKDDVKKIDGDY